MTARSMTNLTLNSLPLHPTLQCERRASGDTLSAEWLDYSKLFKMFALDRFSGIICLCMFNAKSWRTWKKRAETQPESHFYPAELRQRFPNNSYFYSIRASFSVALFFVPNVRGVHWIQAITRRLCRRHFIAKHSFSLCEFHFRLHSWPNKNVAPAKTQ